MRELFIYYRVRSTDAPAALAAVQALQARLRSQHPPLNARLLRRPDETGAWQTWMETYSTDPMREPAGITAELQSDIEAQARTLLPLIDAARHTEVFIACAS
jgi:uncharacterized iron-regulated membrane protein